MQFLGMLSCPVLQYQFERIRDGASAEFGEQSKLIVLRNAFLANQLPDFRPLVSGMRSTKKRGKSNETRDRG